MKQCFFFQKKKRKLLLVTSGAGSSAYILSPVNGNYVFMTVCIFCFMEFLPSWYLQLCYGKMKARSGLERKTVQCGNIKKLNLDAICFGSLINSFLFFFFSCFWFFCLRCQWWWQNIYITFKCKSRHGKFNRKKQTMKQAVFITTNALCECDGWISYKCLTDLRENIGTVSLYV